MKPRLGSHRAAHGRGRRDIAVKKAEVGAAAIGALAWGVLAVGAVTIGAVAIGALAIGAVAIKRLGVRRARIEHLSIGTLEVDRLVVRERGGPRGRPAPEKAQPIVSKAALEPAFTLPRPKKP